MSFKNFKQFSGQGINKLVVQFQKRRYQRLFGGIAENYFLISGIAFYHYRRLQALATYLNKIWTIYLPQETIDKTLQQGLRLYSSEELFNTYKKGFVLYIRQASKFFNGAIKKGGFTKSELQKFLDLCGEFFRYYSKTEFFYLDRAVKVAGVNNNKTLKKNFSSLEFLKNSGREFMNQMIFVPDNYLMSALKIISRQFNIEYKTLLFYTPEELISLLKYKRVRGSAIKKRKQGFIMIASGQDVSVVVGDIAKRAITNILPEIRNFTEIRGTVANPGRATGRVTVAPFNLKEIFYNFKKILSRIQKGDILVAETTSPEIMAACQKAGAIITNQGGLLSHAAIVSRELGIPCVVGTKIATQVLKDGDLVEIDAERGVVRILKKAK